MEFPNAKFLGYTHSNNFWGDKNFRYGSTVSLTINGYILDLSNGSGVEKVITDSETLSKSLGVNQLIEINGNSYGEGKITNISFDSGNWTRLTEYTATIEFVEEGYFDPKFNGDAFGSVVGSLKSLSEYLEDFSESFSLNYDSNGDFLSGDQSINVKFSSLYVGDRIASAKNLAQVLLLNSKAANLVHESFSNPASNLKEYFSETYNLIDGSCSFKRNFSHPNNGYCYSETRSTSFDIGQEGIVTVTESNVIKGECGTFDSLYSFAENRFNSVIGTAFQRCNSFFNQYKNSTGIEILEDLKDKKINLTVKKNKFTGTIEYSVSFNNDPSNADQCKKEIVFEISRGEDFIWNVSVNGFFVGAGKIGSTVSPSKIESAFSCFNAYKPSIDGDADSFYSDHAYPVQRDLKLVNRNLSSSVYQGKVTFNYSYSDDPRLDMSSDIRKTTLKVVDDLAVEIHNDFLIPGGSAKYSIAQLANQSTQSIKRVEGSLECAVSALPFCGFDFYTEIKNLINANKGSVLYLETFSLSSDEIEQTINFSADYKYSTATTV